MGLSAYVIACTKVVNVSYWQYITNKQKAAPHEPAFINYSIIVGVETTPRHYKVEPNLIPGEYVRAAELLSESDYGIVKTIWTDECVAAYRAAREAVRKDAAERLARCLRTARLTHGDAGRTDNRL
jgi:hypothetical protein